MTDSTKLSKKNDYQPVQVTQVSKGIDFKFNDPDNVTYPVAPLVSANFFTSKTGEKTLKIRATLYINTDSDHEPIVKEPKEKGNQLIIKFKHSFSTTTPETCDVWYVELDYTSATIDNITQVISYLQDNKKGDDCELGDPPPTSRGTKTDTGV